MTGWLVVDLPLWKMMEWKSVGMIIPFPTDWKVKQFHGSSRHQPVILYKYTLHPMAKHPSFSIQMNQTV